MFKKILKYNFFLFQISLELLKNAFCIFFLFRGVRIRNNNADKEAVLCPLTKDKGQSLYLMQIYSHQIRE